MLQNLGEGHQRLTLQLSPEELGTVTVVLTVHNKELRAVIRAENEESAAALSEQLESLKKTLEEQGLKVAELDVQCGLQDNFASNQWSGENQHNETQDSLEKARAIRLSRLRRDSGMDSSAILQQQPAPALSAAGLHIVA